MARCILIGIGGSGAKSVEAFVHLAAAGLGPNSVCVGLIDQDKSNGNVTRTKELIQNYLGLRSTLRGDRHHLGESSPLFGPDLEFISDIWAPVTEEGRKLPDLFGAIPNEQVHLLNALFTSDERTMSFGEGFLGHPAVGAAAIEVRLAQDGAGEFWDRIADEIAKAQMGTDVLVFVLGSIFGGTGASGFPTISRELRRRVESTGRNLRIRIGGALLLPYFQVLPPSGTQVEGQPLVPATQFLKQAQAALKYYRRLLTREKIWDNLFVLGWDPLLELPSSSYSQGGDAQANPPLLPELFAALAAHEFFGDSKLANEAVRIDRKEPGKLEWADFPNNEQLRQRLGQFLRFAITFRSIYGSIVSDPNTPFAVQAWHKQLVAPRLIGIDDHTRLQLVKAITTYCSSFLQWISTTVFRGEGAGDGAHHVQLFRVRHFALESEIHDQLAVLKDGLDDQAIAAFSELIDPSGGPTLNRIFRNISYASPKKDQKDQLGIGVFCAQLHEMCS